MPNVPLDTRFIGIAPQVNLTERKSALINAETQPYTITDIAGSIAQNGGTGLPFFFSREIIFNGTSCANIDMYSGYFPSDGINAVTLISAPNLVTVDAQILLDTSAMMEINFPLLETVGVYYKSLFPDSNPTIKIGSFPLLETLNLQNLKTIAGSLGIDNCEILTTVDLSSLETVGGNFYISYNNSLTLIDISSLITFNDSATFINNALTQASIDAILYQLAVVINLANKSVQLYGGTNAAPSVTGLTYVDTLIANGCTVTTN